jgi:hypothetical protein
VAKLVGGKRTGRAFQNTPDVTTSFAVYSVKNYQPRFTTIVNELVALKVLAPDLNAYVAIKVKGKWYVVESIDQHVVDHGESPVRGSE